MLKAYSKIEKFSAVIAYFSTQEWTFRSVNMRKLYSKMSIEDTKIFFCDLSKINWKEFFPGYIAGIRLYLAQDPDENLEASRRRLRRYNNNFKEIYTMFKSFF